MDDHPESKKLKLDEVVVASGSGVKNVKMNPLLNHLVIKKVFEILATSVTTTSGNSFSPSKITLDDLKNFRLVCKSWHGETVKLWRQSATLKIVSEREDNSYDFLPGGGVQRIPVTGMGVKRFLKYWDADTNQLRTRPFVRFNLNGFGVDGVGSDCNRNPRKDTNQRFWELIKDSLEHLRVEYCVFGSEGYYREFRDLLRMSKPNLRSFVLKDVEFRTMRHTWDEDGDSYFYTEYPDSDSEEVPPIGHDIPDPADAEQQKTDFGCGVNLRSLEVTGEMKTVSWKDVIKNSPDLESLRICSYQQLGGILQAIRSEGQQGQGQLSKLKHLCVGAPVYYAKRHLINLLACDPPLETLSIFIPYPKWRLRLKQDIGLDECLQKARLFETLRTLHLTCDDVWGQGIGDVKNDPFHGVEVAIPTLKELCMWGNVVGSMNFLKLFPNLEILKINLSLFEKREEFDSFQEEMWHNDAAVEEQDRLRKALDIVQLTGAELDVCMQKLTHFRYDYDTLPVESWRLLGTWMPNLRKLEGVFSNETLAIVCEQWPDLWEMGCLFRSTVDDDGVVIMTMGEKSLKNLSKLKFEYQCGGDLGKLTDACVSGGLLEMGCLSHLEILNCPKMSDDSVEKLNQKIPYVKVQMACPGSGENEDFECCQRKKFEDEYYVNYDYENSDED